jgi:hypothetical protein
MSHHYSGPNLGFPRGDARLDLTDLYAFARHGDPAKSIFIMNFHPSVSLQTQAPTTSEPFAPEARYELRIDTDGDAVANITYQVRLSSLQGGKQSATLGRFEGAQAETGGKVIAEAVPVSTAREAHATQAGDHRFFAGWRSDPFFFDVLGVLNNFQFTTGDFFADKDICSIVLEVPNSQLGPKAIGIWARTLIPADGAGGWVQVDRGAAPTRLPFFPATTTMPTSAPSQRMTRVPFLSSPTLWNTRAATHLKQQNRRQQNCCPTFCTTTPNAPRASPTTVAR